MGCSKCAVWLAASGKFWKTGGYISDMFCPRRTRMSDGLQIKRDEGVLKSLFGTDDGMNGQACEGLYRGMQTEKGDWICRSQMCVYEKWQKKES